MQTSEPPTPIEPAVENTGLHSQNKFALTATAAVPADRVRTALARNHSFAQAGDHRGATPFPNLGLFVITCLDPRTDPAHFLGLNLSDAMVIRNVGGRATPEVINHVAFISQLVESVLPEGPLFEVAVIHHTQCGSGALADDDFRRRYAGRIGVDEISLRADAVLNPAETVTRDVELLCSASAISARVTVSGHVYDVTTGLVETILPSVV